MCGTPGTGVVHLVQMGYTWYRCGTPGTGVVHLVQVWYTRQRCGTAGTDGVHLVQVWYTWNRCDTPGTSVVHGGLTHRLVECRTGNHREIHNFEYVKYMLFSKYVNI